MTPEQRKIDRAITWSLAVVIGLATGIAIPMIHSNAKAAPPPGLFLEKQADIGDGVRIQRVRDTEKNVTCYIVTRGHRVGYDEMSALGIDCEATP